jgi:hypothetical protein
MLVLPPPFGGHDSPWSGRFVNGQSELTLKHVQQKSDPILRPDARHKDLEQDDDSKKSHLARALSEE